MDIRISNNNINKNARYPTVIQSIKKHFKINKLHNIDVTCLVQLSDSKIATGSFCSLSICKINYSSREWIKLIQKSNAHLSWIWYLLKLKNSKMASCSEDRMIKIWDLSISNTITLESSILGHSNSVWQVIALSNNRLASISYDNTIKLWENDLYLKIDIPFEKQKNTPCCIFQLKNQIETLCVNIKCDEFCEGYIVFYNLIKPFNKKGILKNIYTTWSHGIVELDNGYLALSRVKPLPSRIIIIDPFKYEIIAEVINEEFIQKESCGSLCALGNSIYYALYGCFCQIVSVNGEYQITFKMKVRKEELYGWDLILIENGHYVISNTINNNQGLTIYQCKY